MKAHFVEFFSPGTLFAESTVKPVESWDIDAAMEMAHSIVERHGATPYGFRFITRGRTDDELDAKVIEKSPFYFLGGRIETLAEVKARGDARDETLIRNMECNNIKRIITTMNGWKATNEFRDNDVVLDWTPRRST